jgi:chorismate dehydratase
MALPRTIGLIQDILAAPLVYALQHNKIAHPFTLRYASLAENAHALTSGEVAIALVSPIDYARNSGEWEILPGLGISSFGTTGEILVLFRQDLQRIHTIATDLRFPSEIVLTQIVFLEKFGDKPSFLTKTPSGVTLPVNADAVLLVGDAALKKTESQTNILDLADEWSDITGLPFVHSFFVARRETIDAGVLAPLLQSLSYFRSNQKEITMVLSAQSGIKEERLDIHFSEEIRYSLDDLDLDGIRELFRYCYYHGMLDEIPDLLINQTLNPGNPSLN